MTELDRVRRIQNVSISSDSVTYVLLNYDLVKTRLSESEAEAEG